MAFLFRKT